MKSSFGITLALLVATTTLYAREDIRSYVIPKERKSAEAADTSAQAAADTTPPIQWKTPAGWTQRSAGNMVIANLSVPGKDGKNADVSITSFPGDVGGELGNINRWRSQLGLAPVTDVGNTESVQVGGLTGKLFDISSDTAEIYVVTVARNGATWFFKLKGDKETVADAKPAFREFLNSIQFTASGETADAADPHAGLANVPANGADPHAGLNIPAVDSSNPHAGLASQSGDPHAGLGQTADNADAAGPKMDVPPNWKEKPAGAMVLKSYTVTGSKGGNATVSISSFPGDVGGKLANVNRWRNQLGQSPVGPSDLDKAAPTIETPGGTGYYVDLEGVDGRTGKPAHLVAAAIPHDGNTWFYKLLGDKNTVEESKDAFLKFVKSVRY